MALVSIPPPIGCRVVLLNPEWAKGRTGVVETHVALHDRAKDRRGCLVEGYSFDVRLDEPYTPPGKAYVFLHAHWLLQGDAQRCETGEEF